MLLANSGAEAVEGAIKLAKKRASKSKGGGSVVVAFQARSTAGSDFGSPDGAAQVQGEPRNSRPGVVHVPPPYWYRYGDGLEVRVGRRCAVGPGARGAGPVSPPGRGRADNRADFRRGRDHSPAPTASFPAIQANCGRGQLRSSQMKCRAGWEGLGSICASRIWDLDQTS